MPRNERDSVKNKDLSKPIKAVVKDKIEAIGKETTNDKAPVSRRTKKRKNRS